MVGKIIVVLVFLALGIAGVVLAVDTSSNTEDVKYAGTIQFCSEEDFDEFTNFICSSEIIKSATIEKTSVGCSSFISIDYKLTVPRTYCFPYPYEYENAVLPNSMAGFILMIIIGFGATIGCSLVFFVED